MGILSKSTIEKWILPHLTVGERVFETTVPLTEIVDGAARAVYFSPLENRLSMA
jgi:hypothetical protein